MDRSRIAAAAPGAVFVKAPGELAAAEAEILVVDLGRPGVIEALADVSGRRVIGFGSHVDRERLDAARAAGCTDVLARSAFFARIADLLR
jgi:hypothetical protein